MLGHDKEDDKVYSFRSSAVDNYTSNKTPLLFSCMIGFITLLSRTPTKVTSENIAIINSFL